MNKKDKINYKELYENLKDSFNELKSDFELFKIANLEIDIAYDKQTLLDEYNELYDKIDNFIWENK